ncbi:MAG: hypothetical protein WCJ39_05820 [bacterium]
MPIAKQTKETLEPVISEQRFFAYTQKEQLTQEIVQQLRIIPSNYQTLIESSIEN